MNTIYKVASFIIFIFITQVTVAQTLSTAVFEVPGNCGMCKKRIETAAKISGVESAVWDDKTHKITTKYDSKKVNLNQIQQAIAKAGHDTPLVKAEDDVYAKLHECCLYERLGEGKKDEHAGHNHDDHAGHNHDDHAGHNHDDHAGHNHAPKAKHDDDDDHEHHEHIITGVVVNEDGKAELTPIVGVNIKWLEAPTKQTTSNENGVFKIKHEKGYKHLIFSHPGMQADTIVVKDLHEVLVIHSKDNVLSEVVVSRSKKATYINKLNPNRMEVLTTKELFKAACCDLSESFSTNASVDVVSNDAVTGSKQIQMLGLSGIYTQLTVEGLPGPRGFATPLGLNSIAGTWINSIEISKGIGSVVNGFENMAGQINIELKKPHETDRLFFNAYANNMGRTDINLNLAQKLNDKWSVGFLLHDNFMYNKGMNYSKNGYRDAPVGNLFSGINRWHYEDGKGVIAQFGVKYLKDDRTGGHTDFNKSTDKGTTNRYGIGFDNQRIEGFAKIGYVFPENRLRSIGLQLSGSNYKQDSYFGLTNYRSEQSSGYANLIFQDVIGSIAHKYKVGASISYDDYDETITEYNFKRKEAVTGAFAEYTFSPAENFDAVLGLRQDYNSLYGWFTTPRAVVRYAPTSTTTLRLSSGRGQRTANIFAENMSIFASSRTIDFASLANQNNAYGLKPEVSWNTGLTFDQDFQLFGREAGISMELFHNNFQNQVVIDFENPRAVSFYNLEGKSFSNSLQTELRFMPAQHFEARFAYRLLDVQTDYASGRLQKPLTAKHRGFMNLAYNLHSGWSFDYTLNVVGKKRMPSTAANPVEYQLPENSKSYVTMNAQVSRKLGKNKNIDIYVGGENLTNYYQKDPILGFDQPFGQYFDTNLLWGPLTGRMFYTGVRYHIK
ncbi:TonB-dependent receptor domain-containing protein [Sphingobacterium yanglingense]|uniref:Outer membrane receptor for ferrienterochelin and colicin n=1 Tax=Sphingobacterium yanglingense TaxID=1437280 RepID=A0A4R6WU62_9SPHI|nr:TonB-dependent receptor [Sphingobacterium yanglingense]TDQ82816.1 outer membrane receptor for ferrienterochelin and colicin [Sphingobacterium yanglingense]